MASGVLLAAAIGALGWSAPATAGIVSAPLLTAPLSTSSTTAAGTWAIVPMGHLEDPLNTFWEVFFRPGAGEPWLLVTPPGVADNGGLVIGNDMPGTTTVAFEPSQELRVSPLADTSDGGRTWVPGLLPDALDRIPDALAASPTGKFLALVRNRGGTLVQAQSIARASWQAVVNRDALSTTAAGRECQVGTLTAVTGSTSSQPLLGSTCANGDIVGVFSFLHGWRLVGPRLSAAKTTMRTSVLRLLSRGALISGLVTTASPGGAHIVAIWSLDQGVHWTVSSWLGTGSSADLMSTSSEGNGFAVLLKHSNGSTQLWSINGPGASWRRFPNPPSGTQTVMGGASGTLDALAVNDSTLTDWTLSPQPATWKKAQSVNVPIEYGSSG